MKDLAIVLSAARSEVASELSRRVSEELHQLAMPSASITFLVEQQDFSSATSYGAHGIDEVKILFTPHKGADSLPLSKIASGGEMSRVMLGIEVVVAEKSKIGTYIFDEIDSGVGGKAALEIGRRLKKLSREAQVIVVTHLPQVAVWGEKHLVVLKDESGSVTSSSVLAVEGRDRVIEIARLLSGQEGSESAQEHAQELLTLAAEG
jgi:DNA repair protein RecN (Recombination protein N)